MNSSCLPVPHMATWLILNISLQLFTMVLGMCFIRRGEGITKIQQERASSQVQVANLPIGGLSLTHLRISEKQLAKLGIVGDISSQFQLNPFPIPVFLWMWTIGPSHFYPSFLGRILNFSRSNFDDPMIPGDHGFHMPDGRFKLAGQVPGKKQDFLSKDFLGIEAELSRVCID